MNIKRMPGNFYGRTDNEFNQESRWHAGQRQQNAHLLKFVKNKY
jgi:hypothetical protein